MSLLAPLVDGAQPADRTNLESTFLSYYAAGAAIALGLDLELRGRTGGRASLDTLMRAMWERFGASNDAPPGLVARPYTLDDFTAVLARVSADEGFAREFVGRHVTGREAIDFAPLLARAGFALRPRAPGRPTLGLLQLDFTDRGARVDAPPLIGSPAWSAGIAQDDVIVSVDDVRLTSRDALAQALRTHAPGDEVVVVLEPRGASPAPVRVRLAADPVLEVVDLARERSGLTGQQRAFRAAWLGE
jgi:predicted metalloprotease with PDZ domain